MHRPHPNPSPEGEGLGVLPLDRHHMLHLADHAANLGRVLELDAPVHLVEAEPDQRLALVGRAADRRPGLGELDLRHLPYSVTAAASASAVCEPPRPSRSAIFLPRRWATDLGEVCSPSASKVARIML